MDTAILSQAFIYIMYPSNYDPNDINTRQFYIGSTFNNCNDIKIQQKIFMMIKCQILIKKV